MKQRWHHWLLAGALCMGSAATHAGWDEGHAAYEARRYEEAMAHFQPLADRGDAAAQNRLGYMAQYGLGTPRDLRRAAQWYRLAANQGLARAQANLASLLYRGAGDAVARDTPEAVRLYGLAAAQGHAESQALIGRLMLDGLDGVRQDTAAAVRLIRQSAEQRHAYGQFLLGTVLDGGEGVPEDVTEATRWFQLSAQQDYPPAQYALGMRLLDGRGVARNPWQAFDLLRKAAEEEHTDAQRAIGYLYDEGIGVLEDDTKALHWTLRAAEGGDTQALVNLAALFTEGDAVPPNPVVVEALQGLANTRRPADKQAPTKQDQLTPAQRDQARTLQQAMAAPEGLVAALKPYLPASAAPSPCPPMPEAIEPETFKRWKSVAPDRGALWRIRREGQAGESWLYGTVHFGPPKWLAPGPQTAAALQSAETIAIEVDLSDLATQAQMQQPVTTPYPVSADVTDRLQRQLDLACLTDPALKGLGALQQGLLLTTLAGRRDNLHPVFAQEILLQEVARYSRKKLVGLETARSQQAALQPRSAQEQQVLLASILADLERKDPGDRVRDMAAAWDQGDMDRLTDLSSSATWCNCPGVPELDAYQRRLNDERNGPMAERIDTLLREGKPAFIGVGALHMTGPNSLVTLLTRRGYQVERIPFER